MFTYIHLKSYISGFWMQYCSRKKKENNETKGKLFEQISGLKQEFSLFQSQ